MWRVTPKVLLRGRNRNVDEFYVVKNVLEDDGEDLSEEERAQLDKMRFEFETHSAHGTRPTERRTHPRSRRPR